MISGTLALVFSWYQIDSDSAASPVSCKSYLASTDSEAFAAVITFHSCKTRSRSISDRRAGLIKLYIHESISSNWTGLYFILSEHPHTVAFSVFSFNAVLFFVPNRVGVGVVSRGIQTGSANCIYCERNVEAGGREGCRETELPFMLKKKYQKYG